MNVKVGNIEFSYRRFLSDFVAGIITYFYVLVIMNNFDIESTFNMVLNIIKNASLTIQLFLLILAIPTGAIINALSWISLEKFSEFLAFFILIESIFIEDGKISKDFLAKGLGIIIPTRRYKRYLFFSALDDFLGTILEKIDNKLNTQFPVGLGILFRNLSFLNLIMVLIYIVSTLIYSISFSYTLFTFFFFSSAISLFLYSAIKIYVFTERVDMFIALIVKDKNYRRELRKFLVILNKLL